MGTIAGDQFHEIVSEQAMKVEREWKFEDGELYHERSTITDPVENSEDFRCRCGESFDSKEEAEGHMEAVGEENQSEEDSEDGYDRVEFLKECPEFMGTDLETYGPFEEGDTAEVPEDNAEILVNRGNAERRG